MRCADWVVFSKVRTLATQQALGKPWFLVVEHSWYFLQAEVHEDFDRIKNAFDDLRDLGPLPNEVKDSKKQDELEVLEQEPEEEPVMARASR